MPMQKFRLSQDNEYTLTKIQIDNALKMYNWLVKYTTKRKKWFSFSEITRGTKINPQQVVLYSILLSTTSEPKQLLQMRDYNIYKPTFRLSHQVRVARFPEAAP